MAVRILVAKPGLDGHDRGAKIVARTLRDAGFEVIYTGIRKRIEDIASIAVQEDVALVGLSILSGAHVALTTRITGEPDGPPTLPGYSSADNSTGLAAALGLLAQITSGRGGQVDVSLRDVMLSQLSYHASAYLNDGVEPQRRPFGAHSYYVPAQMSPTADGYLALFITHDGFWKSFATEAQIEGFETMAERVGRRDEVLAVVAAALATDTAANWEARLRPLPVPAAAVRTLPEALKATPEIVVTAGDFRLVGNPIRIVGYQPDYRRPPTPDS